MAQRSLTVRIDRQPLPSRRERVLRAQGAGIVALGCGILAVWNPLTHPGPTVCLLRHVAGLPCPMCGMTRGVALCLRGHPLEASAFNPLTVPVLLVALTLAGKWALESATGRRYDVIVPPRLWRGLVWLIYGLFAVNWLYMLIYRREDSFAASWLGQLWALLTT